MMSRAIQLGKVVPVFLAVVFMVGCATVKPMAISAETAAIDTSKESLVLMTIKTSNAYKPGY